MRAAAARFNEVTDATDIEVVASKPQIGPSYAPTLPVRSRLVFPGPKMRLQTRIVWGDRQYALRGVFAIEFREVDDCMVLATHRNLPVHGHGPSQAEAIEAFCEAFDLQWRRLVDVDQAALTEGGRRRKKAMQDSVDDVLEGGPTVW